MSAEAQTIPADLLLVAGELVNSTIRNYENNAFANISRDAVAKAILAERERCALIAGYYAQACLETESDGSGYYACSALIDEIRRPKSPEPPMPAIDDNDLPF